MINLEGGVFISPAQDPGLNNETGEGQRTGPTRTWFIKTSVPAFKPAATESSNEFSNRFFSLTTAFRKSVLSMCGAYG